MGSVDLLAEENAKQPRPLHIGLLWHTVFNQNLGVGALTLANAGLVAEAAERAGFLPVLHLIGSRGGFDYGHDLGRDHASRTCTAGSGNATLSSTLAAGIAFRTSIRASATG